MSQKLIVELSDELYTIIEHEATEANISLAQVASASLEQYFHVKRNVRTSLRGQRNKVKPESQAARGRFEKHFGTVDLGHATDADNEKIDADLEREYANTTEMS